MSELHDYNKQEQKHVCFMTLRKKPSEWQKRIENDEEIWRKWRNLKMIENQETIKNDERIEETWKHWYELRMTEDDENFQEIVENF